MQTMRKPAPELPVDLAWVNTDSPPRIGALRGRVVLLWFWSGDSVTAGRRAALGQVRTVTRRARGDGLHCPSIRQRKANACWRVNAQVRKRRRTRIRLQIPSSCQKLTIKASL